MKFHFLSIVFLVAMIKVLPVMGLTILVTSENPIKLTAVKEAFEEAYSDETIIINSCPATSGVAEQPVGEEGERGALMRLVNAHKELVEKVDYTVSVENFIEKRSSWQDRAVVLLRHELSGKQMRAYSAATMIPSDFVEMALANRITVGEVIHQHYPERNINAKDWHSEKEFGGLSRKELIKQAVFKALHAEEIAAIKHEVALHPDFPKKGILFQDFSPVMRHPDAFKSCIKLLAKRAEHNGIDVVVGLESRGFILGAALAYELGVAFVPIRKAGKTPGKVIEVAYEKEYGFDRFALAEGAIQENQRVLIVDDLIATGGSAKAAVDLIDRVKGIAVEFNSLLQIPELEGAKKLGIPAFNLID